MLTKEPETIEWIDTFNDDEVLFDIGANVGATRADIEFLEAVVAGSVESKDVGRVGPMGAVGDVLADDD